MSMIRKHAEPNPVIVANVHYYTIIDGKFRHLVGDIKKSRYADTWYFAENFHGYRETFQCNCANTPETVWFRGLWMQEDDVNRAKQLLAEYEQKQIDTLQKKIDRHRSILAILTPNLV